jgi:hypothetical protein
MISIEARAQSLRPHFQQRENLSNINKAFGYPAFSRRQRVALILFVEQLTKTVLNTRRQTKLRQVSGQLNFELDRLAHAQIRFVTVTLNWFWQQTQLLHFREYDFCE